MCDYRRFRAPGVNDQSWRCSNGAIGLVPIRWEDDKLISLPCPQCDPSAWQEVVEEEVVSDELFRWLTLGTFVWTRSLIRQGAAA